MDNHLAHALCQGSRGPLPRRNYQAIRPMPPPASVRSSILALQPSPSTQRLAPGASRQTRGFTNRSLISSPGAVLSSTSCLHARAKIRRHALSAQSFSCNMLFRMGLCELLTRHILWWTLTCFFTFSKHRKQSHTGSSYKVTDHCIGPPWRRHLENIVRKQYAENLALCKPSVLKTGLEPARPNNLPLRPFDTWHTVDKGLSLADRII